MYSSKGRHDGDRLATAEGECRVSEPSGAHAESGTTLQRSPDGERERGGTGRPSVSVVVPTHNRRHLLPRTLSSVLGQVGVDLEVIVVDEASRDGTAAYLRELDDDRVRVVRHERPKGTARARNAGIDLAAGSYVAFCDDDDLWAPDKLAVQLDALRRQPEARWSAVGIVVIDEYLRVIGHRLAPAGPEVARTLLAGNVISCPSGVVAATDLLREVGGFDPALPIMPDWDLWIRLALVSPLASCDRPLLAYLRHSRSQTSAGGATFDAEYRYLRDKFADERRRLGVELCVPAALHWVAEGHARAGQRWPAVRRYLALLRYRDVAAFKRMPAVLLWPGAIRLVDRRAGRRVPRAWLAEVAPWLRRYAPSGG
ncbi:MAG TPA: glycosyltransferase [Actinomycetes bacterium]